MRKIISFFLLFATLLTICNISVYSEDNIVEIMLNNENTTVDGQPISTSVEDSIYLAYDIIYYPEGKDSSFGAGIEDSIYTKEEADKNAVVHITKPGTYKVIGDHIGQIAIDLGKDSIYDKNAVVNLILDNVEIMCTVAPAICVYNVYECGDYNYEKANVSTENAGFNLIIAENSTNIVNGSYVDTIFVPGSLTYYENGTVESATILHNYSGAIHSNMSMNINFENQNGILTVTGKQDGISSKFHLTINGGTITVNAQRHGFYTYANGDSVLTINNSDIYAVSYSEKEYEFGTGINSQGWIVLNGGKLTTFNSSGKCNGIKVIKEFIINNGEVLTSGIIPEHTIHELKEVVIKFKDIHPKSTIVSVKQDDELLNITLPVNCSSLSYIGEKLNAGRYQLLVNNETYSDKPLHEYVTITEESTVLENVDKYVPIDYFKIFVIVLIFVGSVGIIVGLVFAIKFVVKKYKTNKEQKELAKKLERKKSRQHKKKKKHKKH